MLDFFSCRFKSLVHPKSSSQGIAIGRFSQIFKFPDQCSSPQLFYLSLANTRCRYPILSSFLSETDFCIGRLNKSFKIFILHFLLPKIILLVIFGTITGLKICWVSNSYKNWMGEDYFIKIFNTLFRDVLDYCRKFEDIILKIL